MIACSDIYSVFTLYEENKIPERKKIRHKNVCIKTTWNWIQTEIKCKKIVRPEHVCMSYDIEAKITFFFIFEEKSYNNHKTTMFDSLQNTHLHCPYIAIQCNMPSGIRTK